MGEDIAAYVDPPPFRMEAAGHSFAFFPGGKDRLDTLLALIEGARESLRLCFYIFAPDATGTLVRDALARAAARGVKVTLVVDDFGSSAERAFFDPLVEAGGDYRNFLPRLSRRYLIRNHQKIVLVDGRTAMMGGFNIEDGYFAPPKDNGWSDLGFTIEGEVVARIGLWFDRLEDLTSGRRKQFRAIRRAVREWDGGSGAVQLLVGGPVRSLSSWARVVGRDLMYGQRLDLVMAYFSPSRRLLRRIRMIARKGETRLVMAGKSDNGATIGASRLLYRGLLKSRARVWEFEACKLHSKLMVLDDAVYIGSANFDMRSLYLNLEIVLRVEDAALADRMRQLVTQRLGGSREITLEEHRKEATWFNRLRWTISWFLVSVLDYTVSRRLNLGL